MPVSEEQLAQFEGFQKRCNQCKQRKPIVPSFYIFNKRQYRKRPDGTRVRTEATTVAADTICKACRKERAAKQKERLRQQGILEQTRKEWKANMDQEKRRRTARDYARQRALITGQTKNPRGPDLKYRHVENESQRRVNPDLFLEWLDLTPNALVEESEARRIRAIREGKEKTISWFTVDAIMTRSGLPGQAAVLYPEDQQQLGEAA